MFDFGAELCEGAREQAGILHRREASGSGEVTRLGSRARLREEARRQPRACVGFARWGRLCSLRLCSARESPGQGLLGAAMCPGLDRWYFLGPLGLKSGWPEQPGGTQPAGVQGAAWGPGAGWGRWVVPGICLPWGPVRPWEQLGCRKVVGQAAGCGRDRAIVLLRSDLDYVEHLEEGGILTFQGGEQGAPLLPRLWPWCPPVLRRRTGDSETHGRSECCDHLHHG